MVCFFISIMPFDNVEINFKEKPTHGMELEKIKML